MIIKNKEDFIEGVHLKSKTFSGLRDEFKDIFMNTDFKFNSDAEEAMFSHTLMSTELVEKIQMIEDIVEDLQDYHNYELSLEDWKRVFECLIYFKFFFVASVLLGDVSYTFSPFLEIVGLLSFIHQTSNTNRDREESLSLTFLFFNEIYTYWSESEFLYDKKAFLEFLIKRFKLYESYLYFPELSTFFNLTYDMSQDEEILRLQIKFNEKAVAFLKKALDQTSRKNNGFFLPLKNQYCFFLSHLLALYSRDEKYKEKYDKLFEENKYNTNIYPNMIDNYTFFSYSKLGYKFFNENYETIKELIDKYPAFKPNMILASSLLLLDLYQEDQKLFFDLIIDLITIDLDLKNAIKYIDLFKDDIDKDIIVGFINSVIEKDLVTERTKELFKTIFNDFPEEAAKELFRLNDLEVFKKLLEFNDSRKLLLSLAQLLKEDSDETSSKEKEEIIKELYKNNPQFLKRINKILA